MGIPKGILWLKWDDTMGILIDWQYPNQFNMSIVELLAIYTSQTMGNTSLPRFASYATDGLKLVSYFGGDSNRDMAILLLNDDEVADNFKDRLINFYHDMSSGITKRIDVEGIFDELFTIVKEHHEQNKALFQSMEGRFETYLGVFKDFVQVLDARMTKLENNILKLTNSLIAGECRGS